MIETTTAVPSDAPALPGGWLLVRERPSPQETIDGAYTVKIRSSGRVIESWGDSVPDDLLAAAAEQLTQRATAIRAILAARLADRQSASQARQTRAEQAYADALDRQAADLTDDERTAVERAVAAADNVLWPGRTR